MEILILDGGLQGLSCGNSLYKTHTLSIITTDLICKKSCFFKKVYTDVTVNEESFYRLLECHHFDILLPISDFTVPYISQHKSEIEERFCTKCAAPSYDLVYIVEDKSRFMDFCQRNNVPHPKTSRLINESLDSIAAEIGFPALIKPDYSVGARGITRVNNLEELKRIHPIVSEKYGKCSLQEFIDNQEYYYNVMLYRNKEGKILASAILKIVRMYPVGAGSSSCCISVENQNLINICSDCLDKLNWVGMADFDVLQRLDNGEYKIIEINPRVPASLRGAAISGVNFPEIIVNDLMELEIPSYEYKSGKTMRYLGLDLLWFLKSPKRFKTSPSWFSFCGHNLFYQDIYKDDVSTWWTWLAEGISKISKRRKKLR